MPKPPRKTPTHAELHPPQPVETPHPEAAAPETTAAPHLDRRAPVVFGSGSDPSTHAATLNRATKGHLSRAGNTLLQLQRQYGNRYVQRVVALAQSTASDSRARRVIQTKLFIGPAHDKYEQEADEVSQRIMRRPLPKSGPPSQDERPIQTKTFVRRASPGNSVETGSDVESLLAREQHGGDPLPTGTRAFMEPRFGADFSGVRVHTGGEADTLNQALNARAFTTGQHIFFKRGDYHPGSAQGQVLLAHELTHVVQQGAAGLSARPESMIQRTIWKWIPGGGISGEWQYYSGPESKIPPDEEHMPGLDYYDDETDEHLTERELRRGGAAYVGSASAAPTGWGAGGGGYTGDAEPDDDVGAATWAAALAASRASVVPSTSTSLSPSPPPPPLAASSPVSSPIFSAPKKKKSRASNATYMSDYRRRRRRPRGSTIPSSAPDVLLPPAPDPSSASSAAAAAAVAAATSSVLTPALPPTMATTTTPTLVTTPTGADEKRSRRKAPKATRRRRTGRTATAATSGVPLSAPPPPVATTTTSTSVAAATGAESKAAPARKRRRGDDLDPSAVITGTRSRRLADPLSVLPRHFSSPDYTNETAHAHAGGKRSTVTLGPLSLSGMGSDAKSTLPRAIVAARRAYGIKFKAGHLLNADFFGSGVAAANLTILTPSANTSMTAFDNPLKQAVAELRRLYETLSANPVGIRGVTYGIEVTITVSDDKWGDAYPDNCIADYLKCEAAISDLDTLNATALGLTTTIRARIDALIAQANAAGDIDNTR